MAYCWDCHLYPQIDLRMDFGRCMQTKKFHEASASELDGIFEKMFANGYEFDNGDSNVPLDPCFVVGVGV